MDILIGTVPQLATFCPIMGPYQIKAVLDKHGFDSVVVDFNLDLFERVAKPLSPHVDNFARTIFDGDHIVNTLEDFKYKWELQYKHIVRNVWLETIAHFNPEWIGLSIFSVNSKNFARYFLKEIRKKFPKKKIVIGGPYVIYCGPHFLKEGIIDYYIAGEGEAAIIELMNGNTKFPGINGLSNEVNLNDVPTPDYGGIDFSKYGGTYVRSLKKTLPSLETISSRGCVRKCTFCDIKNNWPKFRWKDAEYIVNDLETLHGRYGVQVYNFTDSLINGHLKVFNEMNELIIKKIEQGALPQLWWNGQWIVRRKHQIIPEYYDNMAKAGCEIVYAGIESGSEKIRNAMGKNFSNDDIILTMEELKRVGIKCTWLMLTGYPDETEADFEETLDLVKSVEKYAGNTIFAVRTGRPMELYEGTYVFDHQKELGIRYDKRGDWYNDNSNVSTRLDRTERLLEVVSNLGFAEQYVRHKIWVDRERERIK